MEYGFLEGRPMWLVYAALFVIAFARTQATYWIGRSVDAGVRRTRYAERLGDRLERAHRLINRFGPPAVTLSYMTVGVQTAVHLAAGAMRMHFARYLAAMLPGCALWAAIYSLGGMAVLAVWWNMFLDSPALATTVAALVAAVLVGALLVRRRAAARTSGASSPEDTVAT
ncbi:membrane protein DedA with SNARE-associated domain [Lipingzhangella halophila]|uniref:Membrane protein DedA with SNARE-associated domain n=1 Tax=Lipingzhangella halophila TaxID=1783352 RepID=A0A7W7RKF2_9ACTN|nr:VTT domain-containing protein [Lipingzhangella halophila]MBB4933648.1 membrane protein DedA with SNARE-associated domain [Lipingzhangella halophila]